MHTTTHRIQTCLAGLTAAVALAPALLCAISSAATAADAAAPAPAPAPAAAPAPAPAEEKKSKWEASASAGISLTRGNTDSALFTARAQAGRKSAKDELSLGADATYGEQNSVRNAESIHGYAQYNRLFSERAFGYLRVDGLHDGIADVDYRLALSPGGGYYFIKNDKTRLSLEIGPGFIYEKQGNDTVGYLTFRAAERFEHKFGDRARVWQSVEWLPQVDHMKNYLLNAEIGVETALTKKLSLQVYAQDSYDNEPAPNRKSNDMKLVSAIKYSFF